MTLSLLCRLFQMVGEAAIAVLFPPDTIPFEGDEERTGLTFYTYTEGGEESARS